jgi:hypothetical protein
MHLCAILLSDVTTDIRAVSLLQRNVSPSFRRLFNQSDGCRVLSIIPNCLFTRNPTIVFTQSHRSQVSHPYCVTQTYSIFQNVVTGFTRAVSHVTLFSTITTYGCLPYVYPSLLVCVAPYKKFWKNKINCVHRRTFN